jgi:flagellar capping protein FliD
MMQMERTNYFSNPHETEPVDNLTGAVRAFAQAYNHLQYALRTNSQDETLPLGDILRMAMHKSVSPFSLDGIVKPQISLYEIGVAHSPDSTKSGQLSVHEEKFGFALISRESDVRALFIQEDSGLLPRLCDLLIPLRERSLSEDIRVPALRLLNECRRLSALLW